MLESGEGLSEILILFFLSSFPFLPFPWRSSSGASDLQANVRSLAVLAGGEGQASGAVRVKLPQSSSGHVRLGESSVQFWSNLSWLGPLSDLRARPHTSMCLSACWRTQTVNALSGWDPACAGPIWGSASSLEPVYALSPVGPGPDLFSFRNLPRPAMFLS